MRQRLPHRRRTATMIAAPDGWTAGMVPAHRTRHRRGVEGPRRA